MFISHSGPAYLDEEYPITIKVTNVDDKELDVTFDVMLHPPEDDSSGAFYSDLGSQAPELTGRT